MNEKETVSIAPLIKIEWKGPPLTEAQDAALRKSIAYRVKRIASEELSNYAAPAEDIDVSVHP